MRFLPRGIVIVRGLLRRIHNAEAHNSYLTRINRALAGKNDHLSVENTTLRWRLEDVERALNDIGTEDD